ncbi:MAG: MFS transporter [Acidimicrobiia bacterium]|nr:MFS transporter [Acidimicrobiia bacterium]MCL4291500.1 MFS transporter [Acidimicrobiia bacterium]
MPGPVTVRADDAPAGVAARAARVLGLESGPGGALVGYPHGREIRVEATVRPDGAGSRVDLTARVEARVPYFDWFFGPILRRRCRRVLRHCAAVLTDADDDIRPLRSSYFLPPVPFDDEQITLLASACALGALCSFGSALFGQNANSVADAFGSHDATLGTSLAITRAGVLVALVVAALADRYGRRAVVAAGFGGVGLANAATALAPNLAFFTGSQLLTRAFVQATLVVAGIAVVEEAPERARAYAATMFALASGAGFALSVILLPIADLGPQAWRVSFAVSGLTVLLLPALVRSFPETRRYRRVVGEAVSRGRLRTLRDRSYASRFALLGGIAFLTGVFSAPSAQLTNRFLSDDRGFSNLDVSVFRAVTNGIPGLIGVVVGGRLVESRGRRPVAIWATALATAVQAAFFLSDGAWLWVLSAVALLGAAPASIALGTLDAELFPTEVRGTSNALLLVCGVTGAVTGLLASGFLADPLGGLGRSIALCGAAAMAAALLLAPRLPESAFHALDEVSPSRVVDPRAPADDPG